MMRISRSKDGLQGALSNVALPSIGRDVEIAVYIIHNSTDPEDYFFIFDFEAFVERSREGLFVRPKIKAWAGRSDFSKRIFARQFREAFAKEFDIARAQLAAEKAKPKGWFNWSLGLDVVGGLVPTLVANVLLILATTTGKAVWRTLGLPKFGFGKSDETRLEDAIKATQDKVDVALERLEINLHMALYRHAWPAGSAAPLTGVDYDAWPLPGYVEKHLKDGASSAGW